VDLSDVDQLLIGKAIDEAAAALVFHNWRLTPAIDPLEFQEGAAEGGVSDGMDSVLVDKPAPEIELDLVDGKPPEQIKAALEKLGLSMAVALDHDGRVAERYGATAIPQTVIVDREGKVARLFVGGGARFGEQLREALENVVSGESKPREAQP
jgi:hypothetical protein